MKSIEINERHIMQKIIVGGTYDNNGGKSSYIVDCLAQSLGKDWLCVNGGTLDYIRQFNPEGVEVLIWMSNISNDEVKTLGDLKVKNPEMILIQSKRVIEKEYQPSDVVGRIQKSQSALGIMITKEEGHYRYRLLDAVGTVVTDTQDIAQVGQSINSELLKS